VKGQTIIAMNRDKLCQKLIYLVNEIPHLEGQALTQKQYQKIMYGKWRHKTPEQVLQKIKRADELKQKYALESEIQDSLLNQPEHQQIIRTIKIGVLDDLINRLRKEKVKLFRESKDFKARIIHQ
jgi:hypothetical protein